MMDDTLELMVNGLKYQGWTDITVDRGLDFAAAAFKLSVSENYPEPSMSLPIRPGDACMIAIDGTPVINGYVDAPEPSYSATSHTISISGRSKTADLVDASALNEPGQWRNQKISNIIKELCDPFGVDVVVTASEGDAIEFAEIEQGETVYEIIERLCRMRGLTATDTPDGALAITRSAHLPAAGSLIKIAGAHNSNILSGSGTFSQSGRFSDYIVKAQRKGSDSSFGRVNTQSIGKAMDPAIMRHKPHLILGEAQMTSQQCQQRAEWEAARRAGQAMNYACTVQGWRQGPGLPLWSVNQLVPVRDDFININQTLLLTDVSYQLGSQGRITQLKLQPPEAFSPEPSVKDSANIGKSASNRIAL